MAEGIEVRRPAGIERAGARQVLVGLPGGDARREVHERREVPSVERQLLDRPLLDDCADLRRVRPQQRRFGHDRRGLLDPSDFQQYVYSGALVHLQDDTLTDPLLEA